MNDTLPAHDPEIEMSAAAPPDPVADSLIVLLVEDDPVDDGLITARLEAADDHLAGAPVRVVHAGTVAAARAALRDSPIDVVVLDLTLPDTNGLDALRQVRAAGPAIPIIVLAGTADQALALETLRAGAQDYVLKPPPDGATLRRILRYAGERHRLLRELDAALHAADAAARRWRLVAETSKALAASSDRRAAIHTVARLVVPDVADCFALVITGDEEVPALTEVWHTDAEQAAILRAHLHAAMAAPGAEFEQPRGSLPPGPAESDAKLDDMLQTVFASLGLSTGTTVSLRFGGRVRGLFMLAAAAGRPDAVTDLDFARSLADHICVALEQDRLHRQTQRAVAARDRAVSIVSHDLRNPLGTIQMCATALLDAEPAPVKSIHHMAALIQRSAAWMQQILHDLLDRASLDAGKLALYLESTQVSDVIDAAQVMFAPIAAEEEIDFSVRTAPALPRVDVDPHRLLQVLANLLGNAMKFTPAGGRVALSADAGQDETGGSMRPARGSVRFTVSDTGPGISPEDMAHVFDWFWRSPRGERSGSGLGLAISKGLIEAHGGRLLAESSPGIGSTFWFAMPASSDSAPSSYERRADEP